jgi:hypothetical protein
VVIPYFYGSHGPEHLHSLGIYFVNKFLLEKLRENEILTKEGI